MFAQWITFHASLGHTAPKSAGSGEWYWMMQAHFTPAPGMKIISILQYIEYSLEIQYIEYIEYIL
jgi:hypothetical protein